MDSHQWTMKQMHSVPVRTQRLWFVCFCAVIVVWLIWRIWPIRLLYLDAGVRSQAEQALKAVVDREGWILSDTYFRSVDETGGVLMHREHQKGIDPIACFRLDFASSSLSSCAG